MGRVRAVALVSALAFGVMLSAGTRAQSHPPVEAFAELPEVSQPTLSPDGQHFAAIQSFHGRPAAVIYVVNAPPGTAPAVIPSTDWMVDDLTWAKNDRLIIGTKRSLKAPGDDRIRTWYRALAVKPDGSDPQVLFKDRPTLNLNLSSSGIVDVDLDDPADVYAPLWNSNLDDDLRFDLFKVDVETGKSEKFQAGRTSTNEWIMDGHGHVVARIDQSTRPLMDHLKLLQSGDWKDAGDFDATAGHGAGVEGLSQDGSALIVARDNDKGMRSLQTLLIASNKQGPAVFSNPEHDVMDAITDQWTGRVIGAVYVDDKEEFQYFDPKLEALQLGLEKAFPGVSVHAVSSSLSGDRVIAEVDAPRILIAYYFVDRTVHQAQRIASTYPNLNESDLGEMKPHSYKARDGLLIHAYLTLPPGVTSAHNLPLVVMPHGGPDSRDWLTFDWWAQFMANRGYAVLQPNFRGSAGYGTAFTQAGLHQWGLKMQDDITDGVKTVIAEGIADPKRICIVGGSYGGYAALAGATFTPDLYACAVSFAGISDLPKMLQTERADHGADSDIVSFWHSRVGSPYDDSEQLRATSPARHAEQIKCPVLLMHGEGDTTVRIDQSEAMYDAMKDAKKDVQFIRFPGDDHYFTVADTRIRMLTELEKFLASQIGTASGTQALR